MPRFRSTFTPDPRTTVVKASFTRQSRESPGGGQVKPPRSQETLIPSGPPKAVAQPASSPSARRGDGRQAGPPASARPCQSLLLCQAVVSLKSLQGHPGLPGADPCLPQHAPAPLASHAPSEGPTWRKAGNTLCQYDRLVKWDLLQ